MDKNEKNSQFSKNIKSLFNTKYFFNKHKLNRKLKSIISKEKSLNDRKIPDFDYGQMFHFFKVDMKKFDEDQLKRKNFFKSLYDENKRFHKEYTKNYSSNIKITTKDTKPNIKSKTFQKFYDKNRIQDNSTQENNLFNNDPLLVSTNDMKSFYMNKELDEDEEYKDEALAYINKLEMNINTKSILNKVKNALYNYKKERKEKKEKKLCLNKEKKRNVRKFPFIESENNENTYNKKSRNFQKLKRDLMSTKYYKKYSSEIKRYNDNMKECIEKLNKTNNNFFPRNKQISFENNKIENLNNYIRQSYISRNERNILSLFNNTDNDNVRHHYSSKLNKIFERIPIEKNIRKKEMNCSNQIESLYDALFEIRKKIQKNQKKSESELRYLYTYFTKNSDKKFKQSSLENQKLLKLDKELVYSVNSLND